MIRKTLMSLLMGATLTVTLAGCFRPDPDTIAEFRNNTDFVIHVHFFYGDNQNTIEDLLEETGQEVNLDVDPGATESIAVTCTELQAIFIEEAELDLGLGLGPETDTRVYRDGSDFGCGDTIRFTFTTNGLNTDLDVSFAQNPE